MKTIINRPHTVNIPTLCEVTYYIWAEPYDDPHVRPEPSFVFENKYFETEKEATDYLTEWEKNHVFFGRLRVREKVTELKQLAKISVDYAG